MKNHRGHREHRENFLTTEIPESTEKKRSHQCKQKN